MRKNNIIFFKIIGYYYFAPSHSFIFGIAIGSFSRLNYAFKNNIIYIYVNHILNHLHICEPPMVYAGLNVAENYFCRI